MWINKFGILTINQKSPKDITEGILLNHTFSPTSKIAPQTASTPCSPHPN